MLLSLWLGHLLDSWAEICQIFALLFWKIYDINKAFWNQLTFNEIESTETDNAVKGEEDTATKIDIESFEQNLTESETTKLDVGVLEQNSTELESLVLIWHHKISLWEETKLADLDLSNYRCIQKYLTWKL